MNGFHNKYFSVDIVFYNYSVIMQRQTMLSSVVKNTVKPLNSGQLRVLKKLSVIQRCSLLGENFKKIVTFGAQSFVRYSWHVHYLECPLQGGFIDLKQKNRFGRSGLISLQSLALYFAIIYSWQSSSSSYWSGKELICISQGFYRFLKH